MTGAGRLLNILIVVPWDQTRGGVASVVNNLAKNLQTCGHGVSFFHGERTAIFLKESTTKLGFRDFNLRLGLPFSGNHPVLSTLAAFLLFPLTILELVKLVRRQRIDIINVHYPTPAFVFFALCRWLTKAKLVTSVHGADIFPKGQPRSRYALALRVLLEKSDVIVANSSAFKEDFLRLFPHLRERTVYIHNGVDRAEMSRPAQLTYNDLSPYILSIAAHNEKKGLDVLLRAFAEIAQREQEMKLVLVGDGPLRNDLESLASSLHLNDRIVFLGSQGREAVAGLLHGCELFVLPSRSEPFGIAIIEAMACGKPVVATKTGGIPEIIDDGHDGILVEPDAPLPLAHAIQKLLGCPKLRSEIGSRGYAKVKKRFLWEHTASAYKELFQSVIASRA